MAVATKVVFVVGNDTSTVVSAEPCIVYAIEWANEHGSNDRLVTVPDVDGNTILKFACKNTSSDSLKVPFLAKNGIGTISLTGSPTGKNLFYVTFLLSNPGS